MPLFRYRAIDATGKTVNGSLDAADRRSMVRKLSAQGLKPVLIEQKDTAENEGELDETLELYGKPSAGFRLPFMRVSKDALALEFMKRLLVLLSAGMSLGDSVKLLSIRLSDPVLRELCAKIWKSLSEGRTLAAAMAEEKAVFATSTIHLIEAGEASGSLVPVLRRIVDYLEESRTVRKTMLSNLSYPFLVLAVAAVVVVILLTFLLPKIQGMLDQLGGDLPWMTRFLIGGSHFVAVYGPFIAGALAIGAAAIAQWRKQSAGRRFTDRLLLRLPIVGKIYLYSNIYQTTNLMATLLASGVNTSETLRLVERTINNTILKSKFTAARRQIQEGVSMASAIQRVRYMPDLAMDILTVGENTGNIVTSLHDINGIYREELTISLNKLTNATVAVALGGAFALVAVIAISVVLSVLSVGASLQL